MHHLPPEERRLYIPEPVEAVLLGVMPSGQRWHTPPSPLFHLSVLSNLGSFLVKTIKSWPFLLCMLKADAKGPRGIGEVVEMEGHLVVDLTSCAHERRSLFWLAINLSPMY